MNKIALGLSAALALGAAASANAQSGNIDFTGMVTSVTCDVRFGGGASGSDNGVVSLPIVSTQSLPGGAFAGKTSFTMTVNGSDPQCQQGGVAVELNPNRSAAIVGPGYLENTEPQSPANVAIAMRDANDSLIDLSTPWASPRVQLTTPGGAVFTFSGEYVAHNGAATAGDVKAQVQYTLDYK